MTSTSPRALFDPPCPLTWEDEILDARPGGVFLRQSPVFPGGGGQLADRAELEWAGGVAEITAAEITADGVWLSVPDGVAPRGTVRVCVDPVFRRLMSEVHTLAHVVNSVVYRAFDGALLTGVQLGPEPGFRMDFDLPGVASEAVKALEGPINAAIREDHSVRIDYMEREVAAAMPGMFRSKAVAPPAQADGLVRIVEIGSLDRQACGGTHLASTREARQVRIVKVENKGKQNRRVRVGLID